MVFWLAYLDRARVDMSDVLRGGLLYAYFYSFCPITGDCHCRGLVVGWVGRAFRGLCSRVQFAVGAVDHAST